MSAGGGGEARLPGAEPFAAGGPNAGPSATAIPNAGPTDRLLALYALVAALALAFPHRPGVWPLLGALHVAAAIVVLRPGAIGAVARRFSARWPRAFELVAGWYPLLLIPALYSELAVLNLAVHGGRYYDERVQGWEAALFGGQPSQAWAQAAPWPLLSELLHGAYLSYYLVIYAPPLILYVLGRRAEFRRMVFALMLTFVAHYLFFIYFPVQGPRYLFPAPDGAIADGTLYRLTHRVLESGSSQGAAFPSSHVAVAVVQTLAAWRYLRPAFPVLAVVTLALAVGTVYGGFHYLVDAAAGAVLGAGLFAAAPWLWRALGGGADPRPAPAAQRSGSGSHAGAGFPASE